MASPAPPHVPVIPPPRFFFGVSLGAVVFFAVWTWIMHGDDLRAFDRSCAEYWHDWSAGHPGPWEWMVFLTGMGGVPAMVILAIMGSIWQTAINHRALAFAWLGVVIAGGLVNVASKDLIDRDRPSRDICDRAVLEENKSYPSGHAMGSAIGYGLLGYALILPQRHRPRRIAAVLLILGIVLAIGFSRIYLRAHWFSDVIGGWSIGLAWLFFCLGWLEHWRRLRLK